MKNKKRVLVLVHPTLIPPEPYESGKYDLEKVPWRTEYYVISTLQNNGHKVRVLGVDDDLKAIKKAQEEFKPHIAFNLLEQFDGETLWDHNVVSYLELIKLPFTGCNPKGLMLARDKSLSKKLLYFHRIRTPNFVVVEKGRVFKRQKNLKFPLIVKSLTEEGSAGISQCSVVMDDEKLQERISFIHESITTDALVESFIDGRDVYVSVMGNKRIVVFPTVELAFKDAPSNIYKIATGRVKWSPEYREKYKIELVVGENRDSDLAVKIEKLCKRIYKILHLSGYARIDLRVTEEGTVYFIEANPNPDIAQNDEFAISASKAGIKYKDLLDKCLKLGMGK